MGQIIGGAAKPKRCNKSKLSQLGTPAAGEHILVSSNNSMNAAGQGNFDCYIIGNGRDAATSLELKTIEPKEAQLDELLGKEASTTTISHDDIEISTGVISGKLTWLAVGNQNYKHGIVPVEGCSKIAFTATADHPVTFAFLKSYAPATGQSANLCDGTQLTGVAKGLSKVYDLPEDCNFVYFRALDSGNNEDVPQTITLTYPAVKGAIQELEEGLASAQTNIQQNADDIAELDKAINGEHQEDILYEAPTGAPTYAENTLTEGKKYVLQVSIGQSNWVRVGFGKTNSTTAGTADFLSIFASLNIGEYEVEFNAPNPTEYPYIVAYKGSAINTARIVEKTDTEGLEERVANAEVSIVEIQEEIGSGESYIDERQTITFTANSVLDTRSNPILCDFKQGEDVYLDVHGYNIAYVNLMVREKGTSTFAVERLTQEDTTSVYLNAGDRHWFTASKDIDAIAFYAAASVVTSSGTANVRVRNKAAFFVNSQLNGKKILMFGDSITQLPKTGSSTNGKGIVEFFADITGADVVRCAIGGSKLSRTAPVTQVTNATEASNAVQICSMVELSMTGQGNLLTAAAPYLSDDYAKTIPTALAAIDMNTVDAITIFGGTNDMTADVALSNGNALDTSTIEGAINTIVKSVHENYPHIKIFIFTPIVRYFILNGETTDEAAFVEANWSDVYQNSINKHLYDYADEVINVAKENHIPVCDLYRGMGWNKHSYIRYLFRKAVGKNIDGTHPRYGFDKIAEFMASFVANNW